MSETFLVMFYGRECPHCAGMMSLVDELEKQTGLKVKRLEVWHDEKNADFLENFRAELTGSCGGIMGVPAFVNIKARKFLCGEKTFEELMEWAKV